MNRSPKLRSDRPVQIRLVPWFGQSLLNGEAWAITQRMRDGMYITSRSHVRNGFDDALEYARDARREYRARGASGVENLA